MLIRGRKRFTIFSPKDAPFLYTQGKIAQIHSSGVLNYKGSISTRADGLNNRATHQQCQTQLESKIAEIELQIEALQSSQNTVPEQLREKLDAAELELENLLETILDDISNEGDIYSDFSDSENGSPLSPDGVPSSKKQSERGKEEINLPHFCKIDPSYLHEPKPCDSHKKFPLLRKATQVQCWVNPGEMLYLPAGWFHEVSSFNGSRSPSKNASLLFSDEPKMHFSEDSNNDPSSHETLGHLAFNFWFHPPTTDNFSCPYSDNFWESHFQKIIQRDLPAALLPILSTSMTSPPPGKEDTVCALTSLPQKRKLDEASPASASRLVPQLKKRKRNKKKK